MENNGTKRDLENRLYEVVSPNGAISQTKFETAQLAADYARECFPNKEQDSDRTGKGWDIQVVEAK